MALKQCQGYRIHHVFILHINIHRKRKLFSDGLSFHPKSLALGMPEWKEQEKLWGFQYQDGFLVVAMYKTYYIRINNGSWGLLIVCLLWQSKCIWTDAEDRNGCPEVFCRKGVLRKFAKFTEKHLCQSLFFNKIADLRL